jgi:hypothetical protein
MPIVVFKKKEVDGPQSGSRLPPPISMLWLPTSASNRTDLALQRDGSAQQTPDGANPRRKPLILQGKMVEQKGFEPRRKPRKP